MVIFSILVVIFVYDLRHKIIPDDLVYTFATISLGSIFFDVSNFNLAIPTILPTFSGPMLLAPFFLLWYFSRGKWIMFKKVLVSLKTEIQSVIGDLKSYRKEWQEVRSKDILNQRIINAYEHANLCSFLLSNNGTIYPPLSEDERIEFEDERVLAIIEAEAMKVWYDDSKI